MKSQMIRLYLLLSWGLLLMLGLLSWGIKEPDPVAAYSPPNVGEARPNASFHLWQINEIFSCADDSAQFVEFFTTSSSETQLDLKVLSAVNSSGTVTHTFTFTKNLTSSTANKSLLIATASFSNLSGAAGITPDFTLPDGFLFTTEGATVELVGAATSPLIYSSGELPLDGVTSLGQGSVTAVNSPANFADQQGSVSCPLVINKKGPATANSGSLITYTLTVTSSGTVSNTNVVLTDTVPLSTTFVSASDGISPVSGVLTWTSLGTMPTSGPTSVVSRTFVVTANAPIGTVITNANYGVRSDQTSAKGIQVQVSVVSTTFIYLPIIFKDFTFVDEHAADLPSSE